jgi:hypothetical protein
MQYLQHGGNMANGDRAENTRRSVVLVHGILSNGDWHQSVARALWPFFECVSIKYREYHAFGPLNMFFWPLALFLGGLLGWLAAGREGGAAAMWAYLGLLLLFALLAAYRSGFARSICWLLVGAFCLGRLNGPAALAALADIGLPQLPDLGATLSRFAPLAILEAAGVLTAVVGLACAEKGRRSWRLWACALIVVALAWGAGRLAARAGELNLLRALTAVCAVFLVTRERNWTRAQPGYWPIVIGGVAVFASLIATPYQEFALWLGLVLLLGVLEWEESGPDQIAWLWRGVIIVLVPLLAFAWKLLESEPQSGFLAAAALLAVGWGEPVYRYRRTAARVRAAIKRLAKELGRSPSWIAHSLGTYLSGKVFNDPEFTSELDRVLFVGGAIAEDYDWHAHLAGNDPRLQEVRNEHGTRDLVIWLMWMSGSWGRRQGLGGAGWVGMRPPKPTVAHDVIHHRLACDKCQPGPAARIHNYQLRGFRHSTCFLDEQHARDYWLPYLWGHAPADVNGFLQRCRELLPVYANRDTDHALYDRELQRFRNQDRNWYLRPGGRRLFPEQVREEVGGTMDLLDMQYAAGAMLPSQRIVDETAIEVCLLVSEAVVERRKQGTRRLDVMEVLNPPVAIRKAALRASLRVAEELRRGGSVQAGQGT